MTQTLTVLNSFIFLQHNTMGVNCELCADGFYRPQGIDHRSPDACRPCDCDTHGATGHCVKDDSHVMEGFVSLIHCL